jgi:hypothetical protein
VGKFARGLMALSGAALAVGILTVSMPAGAATKVKVSPNKNLTNGKTVKVSGTGFTPGDSVFIVQCVIGDTSTTGSGCNIGNVVAVTVSSKGTFKNVPFTVVTGAIGTDGGTCGTSKTDEKKCDISVGTPQATDTGTAPIAFKP